MDSSEGGEVGGRGMGGGRPVSRELLKRFLIGFDGWMEKGRLLLMFFSAVVGFRGDVGKKGF